MKKQLQLLTKYLEGRWISHQTTYDLTNKNIDISEFETNILSLKKSKKNPSFNSGYICKYNNTKVIYNYITSSSSYPISGKLEKIDKNKLTQYIFTIFHNNDIKITYSNNNIQYTEYIYRINTNFKISVVTIKRFRKYIAICFISNIKILES